MIPPTGCELEAVEAIGRWRSMSQPTGCELEAVEAIGMYFRRANISNADLCLKRISAAMEVRQQAGLAKYGKLLEFNAAPLAARCQHLWEELLDAQAYAAWIRTAAASHPVMAPYALRLVDAVHYQVGMLLYQLDWVMEMLKQEEKA